MVSRAEPATAPVTWPWLVNGAALPASRRYPPRGVAPAGPLRLTVVMAAHVATAAARLTSLRLLDTGSPALVPAHTWAYVPVILRQTAQKMHKPVTVDEQGCPAPRREHPAGVRLYLDDRCATVDEIRIATEQRRGEDQRQGSVAAVLEQLTLHNVHYRLTNPRELHQMQELPVPSHGRCRISVIMSEGQVNRSAVGL